MYLIMNTILLLCILFIRVFIIDYEYILLFKLNMDNIYILIILRLCKCNMNICLRDWIEISGQMF